MTTTKPPTKRAAPKKALATTNGAPKKPTKGQRQGDDVTLSLRARCSGFWVTTRDESRAEQDLVPAIANAGYRPHFWDLANGTTGVDGKPERSQPEFNPPEDPDAVLDMIDKKSRQRLYESDYDRNVWILRDLSPWLEGVGGALTLRRLRNMLRPDGLSGTPRNTAQAIIILSASATPPPELADMLIVIDWPLPDRDEIGVLLDNAIEVLQDPLQSQVREALRNGARDQAIDAAVGLSSQEVQTTFAKSLIGKNTIDPVAIAAEKKDLIGKAGVLEWMKPLRGGMDAVGGLENLKDWATSHFIATSAAARAYGLKSPKGVLLLGIPGCLAEGTRVMYRRGKRKSGAGRELSIEMLYEKFNGNGRVGGRAGAAWAEGLPTYAQSWDQETGRMVYNEITAVIDSGVKECLRITTDTAGGVELTADHPVLCADGSFREAGQLSTGDVIVARGSMKPRASGVKRIYRKRVVIEGLKYHPVAWRKVVVDGDKRYEYGRTTRARLVVEAYMNKIDLAEFVQILKDDPARAETLTYLPADYDVHHADENPLNDTVGNLVVVPHAEHAALHGAVENFGVEYTITATVTAVDEVGVRRCYDVSMAEPHSNLAVNDGIVVHNCGKTLTAMAIAAALGWPLVRLDLGAQKSKYVGESEATLRKTLNQIDAIGQMVVLMDEIEKALAGATGSDSDGGVSADALGTILSWMQDRQSEAFVIATANNVEALPPELLRKGRFSEIFWVDLPNLVERESVLAAALRSNGRNAEDIGIDLRAVAEATESFSGAEIAELVPEAMFIAFPDGGREITTEDLLASAEQVVPMAKTSSEKINRLRETWSGRARQASRADRPQRATVARGTRQLDIE